MAEAEIVLLNGLQSVLRCTFCDKFFEIITHLGDAGIFWIILTVIFLCFKNTRKMGICMAFSLILGLITGNLIMKNLFARTRPFYYDSASVGLEDLLIKEPHDYSFPSGHTLASFNGAISIFLHNKKWGVAALVLAALIAFSRLYLFVHFPTDILGGILLATACSLVSYYIVKRFLAKRELTKT